MIVAFSHKSITKPLLEIRDNLRDQVVIRFLPYKDEHITLHLKEDGSILRTHNAENKSPSVWDNNRIEVARRLSYQNPERHGNYIIHTPLPKIENREGYHLVSRQINLTTYIPRQRYIDRINQTIQAPSEIFLLELNLSTDDNPVFGVSQRITTTLGKICFSF